MDLQDAIQSTEIVEVQHCRMHHTSPTAPSYPAPPRLGCDIGTAYSILLRFTSKNSTSSLFAALSNLCTTASRISTLRIHLGTSERVRTDLGSLYAAV